MNSVACPHCGAANNPQQSKWNYCEKCGGRLPGAVMPAESATPRSAGAVSSSTATLARPRTPAALAKYQSLRAESASQAPARTRPHPMAYVVILISIVVCSLVMIGVNKGKADYVWIACGLGAGLGAFVSQLLGLWPTKRKN